VIEEIRALQPDVIVVVAYGQILPRAVLEIPKIACLNLHASLLPRWRGAAPIQAAIAAGDRETGITVMYMDEGLDTGDTLLQRKIDISPNETGGSLHDRLGEIAPAALLESLRMLSSGNAPRTPQDNALATYAPKLTRVDGRIDWLEPAEVIERKIRAFNPWPGAFTKIAAKNAPRTPQDNALATYAPKLTRADGRIDWSEPAEVIEREIRAFNPWPGAFTKIAAKSNEPRNLKIFSAEIVDLSGTPGEILRADENDFVIAAGKGALSLHEVQLEGKQRMSAQEFVRGFDVASASCR